MCTVSIKIDETALQALAPELNNEAAIGHWAQELIDQHLREALNEDVETIGVEELRAMLHETVKREYARG